MSPLERLNPMQQYLVHEFVEDYEDGLLSRRDMISRVLHITGSTAAAATVLTALGVRAAGGQEATPAAPNGPQSPLSVDENDPRVLATNVTFAGADGEAVRAYQVVPAGALGEPLPLVLICHENRGLTEHIRDVARRLAVEGYLGCAIDLLSRQGGTEAIEDPSEIPAILTDGEPNRHVDDFQSAIDHYGVSGEADLDRVGMTGFCFGGGITNSRAASRGALVRSSASAARRARHRGSDSGHLLRRPRRLREQRQRGARGGPRGSRRNLSDQYLSGHPTRVLQRHRPATQPGAGRVRLEGHAGVVRRPSRRGCGAPYGHAGGLTAAGHLRRYGCHASTASPARGRVDTGTAQVPAEDGPTPRHR
jgi:hypothetical protein